MNRFARSLLLFFAIVIATCCASSPALASVSANFEFGNRGTALVDLSKHLGTSSIDWATAHSQSDGSIAVVVQHQTPEKARSDRTMSVLLFRADGSLNRSFASKGVFRLRVLDNRRLIDEVVDVDFDRKARMVLTVNRSVVSSYASVSDRMATYLRRYSFAGKPDASFNRVNTQNLPRTKRDKQLIRAYVSETFVRPDGSYFTALNRDERDSFVVRRPNGKVLASVNRERLLRSVPDDDCRVFILGGIDRFGRSYGFCRTGDRRRVSVLRALQNGEIDRAYGTGGLTAINGALPSVTTFGARVRPDGSMAFVLTSSQQTSEAPLTYNAADEVVRIDPDGRRTNAPGSQLLNPIQKARSTFLFGGRADPFYAYILFDEAAVGIYTRSGKARFAYNTKTIRWEPFLASEPFEIRFSKSGLRTMSYGSTASGFFNELQYEIGFSPKKFGVFGIRVSP